MTQGQMTVLGLLIVLLALEAIRVPSVKTFLSTALSNFRNAINGTENVKPVGQGVGI